MLTVLCNMQNGKIADGAPYGSGELGPPVVYDKQSFSAPRMIAFSNKIAKNKQSNFYFKHGVVVHIMYMD